MSSRQEAVVVALSGVLFVYFCLPVVSLTLFVKRQVIVDIAEWQVYESLVNVECQNSVGVHLGWLRP